LQPLRSVSSPDLNLLMPGFWGRRIAAGFPVALPPPHLI
jgi:hypothetical protein